MVFGGKCRQQHKLAHVVEQAGHEQLLVVLPWDVLRDGVAGGCGGDRNGHETFALGMPRAETPKGPRQHYLKKQRLQLLLTDDRDGARNGRRAPFQHVKSGVRDFQQLRHQSLVGLQHTLQVAAGAERIAAHGERLLNGRRQGRQRFESPDGFANASGIRLEWY